MAILFAIFFNLIVYYNIFKRKIRFVFLLPVFAILYDALFYLIVNSGKIYIVSKSLMFVFFLISARKQFSIWKLNKWIIFFLVYSFLISLSSEFVFESLLGFINFVSFLLMFPIGYYYIDSHEKLNKLNFTLMIVGIIFIINFVVANIFNIGISLYKSDVFLGNLHRESSFIAVLIILIVPLVRRFWKNTPKKYFYISVAIGCIIILFLTLKRAPIFTFSLGLTFIYIFIIYKEKSTLIRIIPFLSLLIILLLLFGTRLQDKFMAERQRSLNVFSSSDEYQEEGRYLEFFVILNQTFSFKDMDYSLLGKRLLDWAQTRNDYGGAEGRSIHTSIGMFFHGMGITGVILFIGIVVNIAKLYKQNTNKIKNSKEAFNILLRATFIALFAVFFFLDIFSRTFFYSTYSSAVLLFMGSILRLLEAENRKKISNF